MRERLRRIVGDDTTPAGRAFELGVMALVVVSLVAFSVETLPDLSPSASRFLQAVEIGTVAIFTAEYILRIAVTDRPLAFVFSVFGIVDLLAILPFYLGLGLDLRTVRALRLLRVFRALKLVRYSRAVRRLQRAFLLAKEELLLFVAASGVLLWLSAVGIYYFEHDEQPQAFSSIFSSLWWATATLTTVGYGDVYPITVGGRVFTFFVLLVGLGFISVPSGLVAAALSRARELEKRDTTPGEDGACVDGNESSARDA